MNGVHETLHTIALHNSDATVTVSSRSDETRLAIGRPLQNEPTALMQRVSALAMHVVGWTNIVAADHSGKRQHMWCTRHNVIAVFTGDRDWREQLIEGINKAIQLRSQD